MQDYISVKELANKLNISTTAVYKKIAAGDIQPARIGRTYLIPVAQIESITVRRKRHARGGNQVKRAVSRLVREHIGALRMLGED